MCLTFCRDGKTKGSVPEFASVAYPSHPFVFPCRKKSCEFAVSSLLCVLMYASYDFDFSQCQIKCTDGLPDIIPHKTFDIFDSFAGNHSS